MEIAYDLLRGGAGSVRLSVRTPPNILLRELGGMPADPLGLLLIHLPVSVADRFIAAMRQLVLGDLSAAGLPVPAEGVFHRLGRTGDGPSIVDREVVEALRAREIAVVPALRALDAHTAIFGASDGELSRVTIDAVVAATGFRTGLEPLVGHLDVLNTRGEPRVATGEEAAPGLRFIGFEPVPALFFDVTRKARRIARSIAADCWSTKRRREPWSVSRGTRERGGHAGPPETSAELRSNAREQ
jgi:hypothetical protein